MLQMWHFTGFFLSSKPILQDVKKTSKGKSKISKPGKVKIVTANNAAHYFRGYAK
jgi:hypothetical protein